MDQLFGERFVQYQEPTDLSPPKFTEKPDDWPEDGEEFVPQEIPNNKLGTYFAEVPGALQKQKF